jgi:Cu/Ag efflux protein CusF
MKHSILAATAVALALAGCGQQQNNSVGANAPAAETNRTYSGTGEVTAIAGDQVTIAHGPIAGIGWPAMTMTFTAPDEMANGIAAGDRVTFSFRQDGSAYRLTSLRKS